MQRTGQYDTHLRGTALDKSTRPAI
ncbi:hypothetical protein BRAS3843_1340020 [Bradyrhizobium sp. STM 3843]|nr:hypothetical protein BRAS3843_1340020 [Bradyrhizobium sp. STM 3843]